jgi:hypothetical protein
MPDERQSERVGRNKDFLKSRTSVPCHSGDIGKSTGVPKALIEYQHSCSLFRAKPCQFSFQRVNGRRREASPALPVD